MKTTVIFRLFLIFSISIGLNACDPPEIELHGHLLVTVQDEDTDEMIEGAEVTLSNPNTEIFVISDSLGQALFRNLRPDKYNVLITCYRYEDFTSVVNVREATLNILPSIRLSGKPEIHFSDTNLDFGFDKDTVILIVSNVGKGSFSFFVNSSAGWITFRPSDQIYVSNVPVSITLEIDRTQAPVGEIAKEQLYVTAMNNVYTISVFINRLVDIDENYYNWVTIENQYNHTVFTWMAENLRVRRSPEGDTLIDAVMVGDGYPPSGDSPYYEEFGLHYGWLEAMNGDTLPGTQGICPDGWHIPDTIELSLSFEGMNPSDLMPGGISGFEKGLDGFYSRVHYQWVTPGSHWIGQNGCLLTSTLYWGWIIDEEMGIRIYDEGAYWGEYIHDNMAPVRCVKDTPLVEN